MCDCALPRDHCAPAAAAALPHLWIYIGMSEAAVILSRWRPSLFLGLLCVYVLRTVFILAFLSSSGPPSSRIDSLLIFFFPSSSSKKETERRRGENFWWTRDPRLSIRQWQIPLDGSDTHAVKIYKGKEEEEENNRQIRLSSSSSIYPPMCKLNQRQKKKTSKFFNYYCN